MREPGGGTLFSPVIEKVKSSVKEASSMTESIDSKHAQLNNGAVSDYASYVGAKSMLAGSILPPAVPLSANGRLKGGNSTLIFAQTQYHGNNKVLDLSAAERLKELHARLQPFLKPKATQAASAARPAEESGNSGRLPQWGKRKRLRRGRFEGSNDGGLQELSGQGRGDVQASAEDSGGKLRRGHGWALSRPVDVGDAQFAKGAAPRSGFSTRAAANMAVTTSLTRPGSSMEKEREAVLPPRSHKGDASTIARLRSEGNAEQPSNNSNGHMGLHKAATHMGSRHKPTTAPFAAIPAEMGGASLKPRLDLQTLEWPRILLTLSRKEKEDDFLIFKGTKLPYRPKKRPKVVERALHYCMPGSSLCDLSRSRYDIREKKSSRKRPRGLKAMDSMESESD